MTNRKIQIDTLRGIACILLVAYHVVGSTPESGLRISDGYLRELNDALAYIRMPLFTFLSGYVYALRPFQPSATKSYILGKGERLLVPMLVVGTFFALVQAWMPGANNEVGDWRTLHLIPVAHFWFVESLFLIFMILIPLELSKVFSSLKTSLLSLTVISFIYVNVVGTHWLSIRGAIYLFPFFTLGLILCRFSAQLSALLQRWQLLILSAFILTAVSATLLHTPDGRLLKLILGILGCTFLLTLKLESQFLATIGTYSYTIYLYHVFFTAGSRILLYKLDIHAVSINLLAGTFIAIAGSVILHEILQLHPLTRRALLGTRKAMPSLFTPIEKKSN